MKTILEYKLPLHTILVFLAGIGLALTGCGGGSSSSGGGGATPAQLAGTYTATGTITVTTPDGASTTVPFSTSIIVIGADGRVTIDPDTPFEVTGTLNGNSFAISTPAASLNDAELTCTGIITFSGTVSGTVINGSISGNDLICNNISVTITGTYTANKAAAATSSLQSRAQGSPIAAGLRQAIKSAR